jgi:hypothetical protein
VKLSQPKANADHVPLLSPLSQTALVSSIYLFTTPMVMPVNPQATGVMGAAGGPPPVTVPSPFPHAGNQQDLNYVMNLLNQLSEQVRQNREQTEHIVEGVRQIHTRKQIPATAGENPEPNGEAKQEQPQESQSEHCYCPMNGRVTLDC